MAEIGVLALAIDVVQVVKDAAHEASERVRAAQNLGALAGKRYEFAAARPDSFDGTVSRGH